MKILRLDMRTGNSSYEDADETYPMLGGRGLIAALLLKRLKWPVLLAALVLSGIAYPLQTALRRQVLQ